MNWLNKLLGKLPLNENKTASGMIMLLVSALLQKYMPADQAMSLITQILAYFGWTLGGVGTVHKLIKIGVK